MRNKSLLSIIIIFIVLILSISKVYGHSGRTDTNGGHYNRSTGEYHYHHGYPAHQHYNGVCPYLSQNIDDKESQSSNIRFTGTEEEIKRKQEMYDRIISNKSKSDYTDNNYINNTSDDFKYSLDDENDISFDTIKSWCYDNMWWMFWVIIICISWIAEFINKFRRKK